MATYTYPNKPPAPVVDDLYIVNGKTFTWTGEVWQALSSADGSLRSQLAATDSTVLVGGVPAVDLGRKYLELVSITDFGAKLDGVTNDLPAIISAVSFASAKGASVFIPPSFAGCFVDGSGSELIELTKPVKIIGSGYWSWLKVADSVPQTTDIITIRPNMAFGELGYGFENFRIMGEQGNGYAVGNEPARHAIHIDLKAGNSFIGYCDLDRMFIFRTNGWSVWLSNANESAAGVPADYTNVTPVHFTGGWFASDIRNCRISSGVWLQAAGDSLKIIGGSINGYNGVYYDGVPGAGGFKMESVNFTPRGGLLINRALSPSISRTIKEALHADMNPIGVDVFPAYFPTIADTAFIHLAGNSGGAAGSGRILTPTVDSSTIITGGALPVGNPQGLQLLKVGVTLNAAVNNITFGPDTASPLVIESTARNAQIGNHAILGRTPSAAVIDNGSNTRRLTTSDATASTADSFELKDKLLRKSGVASTSETREVARFYKWEVETGVADGYNDTIYPESLTATIKRIWRVARRNVSGVVDTINDVIYFAADRIIYPFAAGYSIRDDVNGDQRFVAMSAITASNTFPAGTVATIRGAAFGLPKSYIKADGANPGSWNFHSQNGVKSDTTANRPTGLTSAARGLMYLDTTLAANGKPIWWNGSAWVDATGVIV